MIIRILIPVSDGHVFSDTMPATIQGGRTWAEEEK
jgi:hypothetical protein